VSNGTADDDDPVREPFVTLHRTLAVDLDDDDQDGPAASNVDLAGMTELLQGVTLGEPSSTKDSRSPRLSGSADTNGGGAASLDEGGYDGMLVGALVNHAEFDAKLDLLEAFIMKQLQAEGFHAPSLAVYHGRELLHKLVGGFIGL
jgi:hypothetical protein